MSNNGRIVGIDLGTTNSEITIFDGQNVIIIKDPITDNEMFPSYVGLTPDDKLVVGDVAKNQYVGYPDRTVRSIKRLMGTDQNVKLGNKKYTPPEISAFILKGLLRRAEKQLDIKIEKTVITVPAYFNDLQRKHTRLAGEIAGVEVVRIINEPTAASLAYGFSEEEKEKNILIYDLGGGTFDISIVKMYGSVNEILASHGDTNLGGDDFDEILTEMVISKFEKQNDKKLELNEIDHNRLKFKIEKAKQHLSNNPFVKIKEELLTGSDEKPINLNIEITRLEYEEAISPLIKKTMNSVHKALSLADLTIADLSNIILTGGSTRTPLISQRLKELTKIEPNKEIHPDLCVALGAGLLAGRLEGQDIDRILVDISPYAYGTSFLGELNGMISDNCYKIVIPTSSPLPCVFTEEFYTCSDNQKMIEVKIYQGENEDANQNKLIGEYNITGLAEVEEGNPINIKMNLDIDGILYVNTSEKITGHSKQMSISNVFEKFDENDLQESKEKFSDLWDDDSQNQFMKSLNDILDIDELLESAQKLLPFANEYDKNQIKQIINKIDGDIDEISEEVKQELANILFLIDDE